MAPYKKLTDEERNVRIKEASELLAGATQSLLDSDGFKAALKFARTFPHYSMGNVMMILAQKPDATRVASFNKWKALGRSVKKGEKAIRIWCPVNARRADGAAPATADTGGADEVSEAAGAPVLSGKARVTRFILGPVFSESQTEGEPLPEMPKSIPLESDDPELPRYWAAVEDYLRVDVGVTISVSAPSPGEMAHGWFKPATKEIWISPEYPEAHQLGVLLHEGAHALTYQRPALHSKSYSLNEVVAESTAFLLLDQFGLDSTAQSAPYTAPYAKEPEVLMLGIERARKLAEEFTQGVMLRLNVEAPAVDVALENAATSAEISEPVAARVHALAPVPIDSASLGTPVSAAPSAPTTILPTSSPASPAGAALHV